MLALATCTTVSAQQRYMTKQAQITFFSEAPLENIDAKNNKASSILDLSSQAVAVSMDIKDFKFDKSLMEEHFNENYLESDKYPSATFSGKFISESPIEETTIGKFPVNVEGDLTIHGVTKKITAEGFVEVTATRIIASTGFKIAIRDYEIDVPKLVIKNIAEIVDVSVLLSYAIESKLK